MPPCMITGVTLNCYCVLRKHSRCMKKGAMMFAAIMTMTHSDAAW